MRKIWVMTKTMLLSFWGINQLHYGANAAERRPIIIKLVFGLLFLALLGTSFGRMAYGVIQMGLPHMVPAQLLMFTSANNFLYFLFLSKKLLDLNDYDQIMSMPVNHIQLGVSRVLCAYLSNLPITALIMLPGLFIYGLYVPHTWIFWPMALLSIFLAPLAPMSTAMLLGALFNIVIARFKKIGPLYSFLLFAGLAAIIFLPLALVNRASERLAQASGIIIQHMSSIYSLADYFQIAIVEGNIGYFYVFALISLSVATVVTLILARFYTKLNILTRNVAYCG